MISGLYLTCHHKAHQTAEDGYQEGLVSGVIVQSPKAEVARISEFLIFKIFYRRNSENSFYVPV